MHSKKIKKLKQKFNHITLAQKYKEFSKHVRISTKGESIIDFKNQESLIELNHCLMDHYFSIKSFYTPISQMAPAIGCRLNYLEWVKELVDESKFKVTQIYDVGTGYSGIFLFLSWRMYGWHGIGVDTDQQAIENCQKIANMNNAPLKFLIGDQFEYLQDGMVVVCNPPFYDYEEERIVNRTIGEKESYTKNGEVGFIQKMLTDSTKTCLYTTMVGRRSSYEQFKILRNKTILKQGNNIRFAISWKLNSEKTEMMKQLNL